ncbi:hypothetical protein [Psychrobacter namhaensis]|uniref:hypothetical protein n=1 Tax=Psychrobacter namhaensis TaxID=292734 RepID=UPI0018E00C47|nr:hypothetical protein [Psychrobacter namhaensis]
MDEEPIKEHRLPSMLEISEMFDKVQSQMNPLSYQLEKINSIQGIASQYERLNPTVSIADIARKAVQPVDFASSSVVDHSAIAMNAQLRVPEAMAVQDTFLHITGSLSANNNVMRAAESARQGMDRNNVYKDAMKSFSQFRKSIEPLRDSLNTVGKAFNGSEFANLVRELQTSRIITESTISEYAGIVKQLESLRNLESFKAIYRLKNFPNEKLWIQNYDEATRLIEDSLAEVQKIDARISDEVSSVDDFNDLSETTQKSLKKVFSEYYDYFIIEAIVSLYLLQKYLDKDLDLSSKSFVFVNNIEGSMLFISNYWNQNKVAIINGLITSAIYNTFMWLFFIK